MEQGKAEATRGHLAHAGPSRSAEEMPSVLLRALRFVLNNVRRLFAHQYSGLGLANQAGLGAQTGTRAWPRGES